MSGAWWAIETAGRCCFASEVTTCSHLRHNELHDSTRKIFYFASVRRAIFQIPANGIVLLKPEMFRAASYQIRLAY